jgi:hypothetical protein
MFLALTVKIAMPSNIFLSFVFYGTKEKRGQEFFEKKVAGIFSGQH